MITVVYHRNFKKSFKRLKSSEKRAFQERIDIFIADPTNPLLNDHALRGKFYNCRSINITGDIRVIYEIVRDNVALLHDIDTHSKLYK